MIDIKTVATGSSGNCYILDDGHTQLMIECGIPFSEVLKKTNFDIRRVVACLVSHEHKDHCVGVAQLVKRSGIKVYATYGTIAGFENVKELKGKIHEEDRQGMEYNQQYRLAGGWLVTAFKVVHEGLQPSGFLIESVAGDRLVFVTDTNNINYTFSDLTHILVEANYKNDYLLENGYDQKLINRVQDSHLELNKSIDFVKRCQKMSDRLQNVTLIHLSNANSNADEFKREMEKATGILTTIAGGE